MAPLVLKKFVSGLLVNDATGRFIGTMFRRRIPHNGLIIEVADCCDPSVMASLFWKTYESAEQRFVNHFVTDRYDVVDLGSCLGVVSCQIARKLRGKRRLFCVEANP